MSGLVVRRHALDGAVRLRSWRLDPSYVHLSLPAHRLHPLAGDELRGHLETIEASGSRGVVTSALSVPDQLVFRSNGFHVTERLHLLRRRGDAAVPRLRLPTRRARRRDHPAILGVDHAAFVPFWQLDAELLYDALTATTTSRLRVVRRRGRRTGPPVAYCIVGRSRARGYIQRLAVHPDHQGRGLGAALLADGLAWLARWRVRETLVNTQVDNARSLSLYRSMGFELQRHGLAVLRIDFDPPRPAARGRPEMLQAR